MLKDQTIRYGPRLITSSRRRGAGVDADDKRTGNETCAHIFRAMINHILLEGK